jgi:eukaryotic-like serine/threonine-protein kinase
MSDNPARSESLRSQRFLFGTRLGEGGMGAVYEAVDRERQVRVAVKTLRQLGPEQVLRFKGEFRKLQGLHHPNLVTLGELVEEQGQWFLTMELVNGEDFLRYVRPRGAMRTPPPTGTLTHHASEGATVPVSGRPGTSEATQPLSLAPLSGIAPRAAQAPAIPLPSPGFDEARLRLALAQLALGLNALHRAGKVHRDIKPSNILVTPEGRLRLLDFGILTDMEEEVVAEGTVYGTAAYMAPEQARGARPSPEMDWYAVGVLLYEALTGHRPFTGSPQAILEAKGQVEPVPPQELVAGLPEDLSRLCVELLRMDPRRRCTGEEVLRRLGLEEVARQEAWATTAMPFVGRQRELRVLHEALAGRARGPAGWCG